MYFNYSTHWPSNWWERRSFIQAWWRLYSGDHRWAPPVYTSLTRFIHAVDDPLYKRLHTQPLYLDALPRRTSSNSYSASGPMNAGGQPAAVPITAAMTFEESVAATLVQIDRRRDDQAAYLGLLRCANDEETLERLLGKAFEHVAEQGAGLLLGPTGIFPSWQPGVLVNHFNRLPPWHTPYNPPYVGELLGALMEPWLETVLYEMEVPDKATSAPTPAIIAPLSLERLAGDLLPLLVESTRLERAFPAADQLDAQSLLAWLQTTVPPQAWLATIDGAAAGFVMLQPDLAPLLKRTGGGRRWLARGYLAMRRHASVHGGRLLLGAVAPEWRGRGIGRQLWQHALDEARRHGWRTLTCGPVGTVSEAAAFLARQNARPQQRYIVYRWSPW
jgi:GNAT superfamily N-acetyltransferase